MENLFPFMYDDGGRKEAGFRGSAGDCVTRAIAIASGLPYREVYDLLAEGQRKIGKAKSARNGVHPTVYKPFLADLGFTWVSTMWFGRGTTHHLRRGDIPVEDRMVVRLSRHLTAIVDRTIRDTYDPSRDGTRCVYGYWYL